MPAASCAEARQVLIVARAGRQLAAAARTAGYVPLVADCYGDLDTLALAAHWRPLPQTRNGDFSQRGTLAALAALTALAPGAPVLWGSGFEDRPALLDKLATLAPLLGTAPSALPGLRAPEELRRLLRGTGWRLPMLHRQQVPMRGRWLLKRTGTAGGAHVVPACAGQRVPATHYAQAHIAGRSLSAAFIAGRDAVMPLGVCEHLYWPQERRPFRYGGAIAQSALAQSLAPRLAPLLQALAVRGGLRGLGGIDFVLDAREQCWLLEINPRPVATFDLLASASAVFRAHLAASAGRALPTLGPPSTVRAHAVWYTPVTLSLPLSIDWPRWVTDRPSPGATLPAGSPVCTVQAEGMTPTRARQQLARRLGRLACVLGLPPPRAPLTRQELLDEEDLRDD